LPQPHFFGWGAGAGVACEPSQWPCAFFVRPQPHFFASMGTTLSVRRGGSIRKLDRLVVRLQPTPPRTGGARGDPALQLGGAGQSAHVLAAAHRQIGPHARTVAACPHALHRSGGRHRRPGIVGGARQIRLTGLRGRALLSRFLIFLWGLLFHDWTLRVWI